MQPATDPAGNIYMGRSGDGVPQWAHYGSVAVRPTMLPMLRAHGWKPTGVTLDDGSVIVRRPELPA
jgi:hypothetical protein